MGPNGILDKGFVADTAVPLYHAVRLVDTEHISLANVAGGLVLGICQEEIDATDVDRGRVVRVRVMGISRGVASAAIALNSKVAVTADGTLAVATAGQPVVGVAISPATTAGEWVDVLLTPGATA